MEDSLENYIKISRNSKASKEPSNTKIREEILITAQRKKECDAKAMQIVEFCIEGKLRSESLIGSLPFINQSHYQDIVEERAVSKLCGYPLCGKMIPEMPKKQFHISTRSNKVYDISERKNYCTNHCYTASVHIKKQVDNSPLWLRKYETMPTFNILDKSDSGLPGEEIDQGIVKPVLDEPTFTSVNAFTEVSLDEMVFNEINPTKRKSISRKEHKISMETINEHLEVECEEKTVIEDYNKIEETEADIEKSNIKKDKRKDKKSQKAQNEEVLMKAFKEWINLETFIFIYGEEMIKQKLDTHKLSDYFESLKIANMQVEQQKKYVEICRKLHLRELAEDKFDSAVIGKALRPIPDYNQLKEENKNLDLKVKSFYSGLVAIEENINISTKPPNVKENEESEGAPAVLPMVDVHSQNAMRRKVFLNSLNKAMQNVLRNLHVEQTDIICQVQSLVKTFRLKPNNIVFKPQLWDVIVVVLLEMLTLKDGELAGILNSPSNREHLDLILSCLKNKHKFLNNIINFLKDIDGFVKFYITNTD